MRAEFIEVGLLGTELGQLAVVADVRLSWTHAEIEAAFGRLLGVHPVLDCRFERRFWRCRWVPVDAPAGASVCIETWPVDLDRRTQAAIAEEIAPERERPIRLTVLRGEGRTRLILNLPHLVADGNGVLTVMQELAAQLTGTGHVAPVGGSRSVWQIARALGPGQLIPALRAMFGEMVRTLSVPFLAIWSAGFERNRTGRTPLPVRRLLLNESETSRLHDFCRGEGATINDGLVLAALGVAARRVGEKTVGAFYTINLRRFLGEPRPIVANLSGFDMVTLDAQQVGDPRAALARVCKVTGEQKSRLPGLGSNLVPLVLFGWIVDGLAIGIGRIIKRLVRLQGHRGQVMTNVGVMDPYLAPFGDRCEDAWMTPPSVLDFPAPIALVTSFAGRLSVAVSGRDNLTASAVEEVERLWRESLEGLIQAGERVPV